MPKNDIDFKSKTYIVLLIVVCIIFFIAVIKAFDYLPKDSYDIYENDIVNTGSNTSQPQVINEDSDKNNEENSDEDENTDEDEENEEDEDNNSSNDIEEIDTPPGVNPDTAKNADSQNNSETVSEEKQEPLQSLYNANKFKADKKYNEAIEEYKSVLENTQDKELIASAYEGLATVYAINKRYGTALSFALKAHNESPNSARALLVAQLYNKTGNTEKATKIINKLLTDEIK